MRHIATPFMPSSVPHYTSFVEMAFHIPSHYVVQQCPVQNMGHHISLPCYSYIHSIDSYMRRFGKWMDPAIMIKALATNPRYSYRSSPFTFYSMHQSALNTQQQNITLILILILILSSVTTKHETHNNNIHVIICTWLYCFWGIGLSYLCCSSVSCTEITHNVL